jgi:hypothetical protein
MFSPIFGGGERAEKPPPEWEGGIRIKTNNMRYAEKVWDWLVWSSADPKQLSLTVKGALTGVVTLITVGTGVAQIHLPAGAPEILNMIVEGAVTLAQAVAGVISAVAVIAGLWRKLIITFRGWHWGADPADYKPVNGPVKDPSVI